MNIMLPDKTIYGVRNTSGDGTAVIPYSSAWNKILILGGALTLNNPGTDSVEVLIKSGVNTLYKVVFNISAVGVATLPPILGNTKESIYINLSANVAVNYTLTYTNVL